MEQSELIPLWKALADPKRRRIIQMLGEKARTTGELCAFFDVSRFAIMRHLKVLEQVGFVRSRREGRQRWNFLNEMLLHDLRSTYLSDGAIGENQLTELMGILARQEVASDDLPGDSPGILIQMDVPLQAKRERVFRALTEEIDAWWSYRIASDSHIQLDAQAGGRFHELFAGGGGALYGVVTYVKPGEEIRFSGSMGLVDEAASNLIQLKLSPGDSGTTRLWVSHRILGKSNAVTADTFKSSWEELLTQQLKPYVEDDGGQ